MASMVTAMKMTAGALNDLRDEDRFQALFEEAVMLCHESDVPFPELPRQRFCGPAPAHSWTTACGRILLQSVLSCCGHCSQPAEAQI